MSLLTNRTVLVTKKRKVDFGLRVAPSGPQGSPGRKGRAEMAEGQSLLCCDCFPVLPPAAHGVKKAAIPLLGLSLGVDEVAPPRSQDAPPTGLSGSSAPSGGTDAQHRGGCSPGLI